MRPFSSSSTYLHPFICLIFELIGLHPTEAISAKVRRIMRVRSIATLCLFALAVGVALKYQIAGLGICICCLIVYLWPNPPLAARSWLEGVRRYSASKWYAQSSPQNYVISAIWPAPRGKR